MSGGRLRLHERRDPSGQLRITWLLEDNGNLTLVDEVDRGAPDGSAGRGGGALPRDAQSIDEAAADPRPLPLPVAALLATFDRYGKALAAAPPPLEPDDELVAVPLPSGATGRVRAFAFRGYGSVLPEDYLLLERDSEPLAGPAPLLAAALAALARAAARPVLVLLLALLALAGCGSARPRGDGVASADVRFQAFVADFYAAHLAFRPTTGTSLGLHEYDGKLGDRSAAALTAETERLRAARAALEAIPPGELSAGARVEREVLLAEVREQQFELETLRSPWKNPMYYMGALDVSGYVSRDYAPLAERARAVIGIAGAAPGWLAQGRKNLDAALPRTFVATALLQTRGAIDFLEGDVRTAFASLDDAELAQAIAAFVAELRVHEQFLDARLAAATDDFALGEADFLRMLEETQGLAIDLPRLKRIAAEDLLRNLLAVEEAATAIDPTRSVREVVQEVAEDRPTAAAVLEVATTQAAEMRRFLIDAKLVTIPSEDVAEVRDSPPFMRWNFAFLDSPGVFEPKPLPSFYYISPPDPAWPEAEQVAYVAPTAELLFTTIHEVWPGHFLHGLHIRQHKSRVLKSFCTYSMSEGWAHYTEEMMWDAGAGGRSPRVHIGQLKEALLRNVRFVAAIGLHTGGMSVDEAMALFQERAYADPGNARQQAVRGTFDPMYLSYTVGKLMITKLRDDWLAKDDKRTIGEFHDTLLGYGCAPLPVIRREMLGDDPGPAL